MTNKQIQNEIAILAIILAASFTIVSAEGKFDLTDLISGLSMILLLFCYDFNNEPTIKSQLPFGVAFSLASTIIVGYLSDTFFKDSCLNKDSFLFVNWLICIIVSTFIRYKKLS